MKHVLLCVMLGALVVSVAHATSITIGGGPVSFGFGGVISSPAASGNPYTFTGPAIITVTDGFEVGDRFSVYDGTTLLGDTSVPGSSPAGPECDSYATCIEDPNYSHGTFAIGDGSHDIDIFAISRRPALAKDFLKSIRRSHWCRVLPRPG